MKFLAQTIIASMLTLGTAYGQHTGKQVPQTFEQPDPNTYTITAEYDRNNDQFPEEKVKYRYKEGVLERTIRYVDVDLNGQYDEKVITREDGVRMYKDGATYPLYSLLTNPNMSTSRSQATPQFHSETSKPVNTKGEEIVRIHYTMFDGTRLTLRHLSTDAYEYLKRKR